MMKLLKYFFIATLALPAFSQEEGNEVDLHPEIATHPGWNLYAKLGIDNPNFNFSRFVPGIDNATLLHVGGSLAATVTYQQGQHQWRNKIGLAIGYNLDQFVSDFVKARDYLKYDSIYYFSLIEGTWGLFGRFNLDTSMLPGVDIQPEDSPTIYTIYNPDGTLASTTPPQNRLTLTGAFSPMDLSENIGIFVRPVTLKSFSWEILGGVNFNQGLMSGKYIIAGVAESVGDAPTVTTVSTLESFYQIGVGIGNSLWGAISDQFTYSGSVNVSYAFYDSGSVVDLSNTLANNISMDAGLGVTYHPLPWLGFSWEGHAKYQPYVTKEFQLDSFLNLNFALSM
jgi:hypothetical protein